MFTSPLEAIRDELRAEVAKGEVGLLPLVKHVRGADCPKSPFPNQWPYLVPVFDGVSGLQWGLARHDGVSLGVGELNIAIQAHVMSPANLQKADDMLMRIFADEENETGVLYVLARLARRGILDGEGKRAWALFPGDEIRPYDIKMDGYCVGGVIKVTLKRVKAVGLGV